MRPATTTLSFVSALLLTTAVGRAEVIAQYTGAPTHGMVISAAHTQAQAFDVTGSPTVTEIQVNIQRSAGSTGYVMMQLRRDSGGSPETGCVAQIPALVTAVPSDTSTWFAFKWSGGGTTISAGRWWIVLKVSPTSDAEIDWFCVAGNPYGAGDSTQHSSDGGNTWPVLQGVDANFKVFGARTAKNTTCTVTATPGTVATSGASTIQVTVRDADANLVQGPGTVNLVATGGTLAQSTLTLSNGQASTTWTAPGATGDQTITANYVGHSYAGTDYQSCSCQVVVGVIAQQRTTTTTLAPPGSTTTRSTINVSATVRDSLNNLVPGGSVSFSCAAGTFACGLQTCSVATAGGVASTTWTAGNGVGAFAIQASYSGFNGGAIVYGASSDSKNVSVDYTNMVTTTTVTVSPDYPYISGRSYVTVQVTSGGNLVPGGSAQLSAPAGWFDSSTITLAGGIGSTIWHAPGTTGDRVITGNYQQYLAGGNRYLASSGNATAHVIQDNDSTGTSLQWMTMWMTNYSNLQPGSDNLFWSNLSSTDEDARGFSDKLGWAGAEYANGNACEEYMKRSGDGGKENDLMDMHDFLYLSGHGSKAYIPFNTSCDDHRLHPADADGSWGNRDVEWAAFSACQVVSDYGVDWMDAMNGLHLICGFDSIMADSASFGGIFADLLIKDGVYDAPHTIPQAWFLANDQTLGWIKYKGAWIKHKQRVIADEDDSFNDHLWGEGYVSADPTPNNGWVSIDHEYTQLNNPTADAGGPYTAVAGQVVQLDGSASSDPEVGDFLFYAWDLDTTVNSDAGDWDNDGTDAADDDADVWGRRPQAVFPTPGVYNIALTVRDDTWSVDQDWTTVTVAAARGDAGGPAPGLRDGGSNGIEIVDNFLPGSLPTQVMLPVVRMFGTALGYDEFMNIAAYWGMQGAAGLDDQGNWKMVDGTHELVVNQYSGNVMYVDRARAYVQPHPPPYFLPSESVAIQAADAFLNANNIERSGAVLGPTTDILREELQAGSRTPLSRQAFQRRVNYARTINVPGFGVYPVVGPGGNLAVMLDEYADPVMFVKVWRHAYPQEEVPLYPAVQAIADFHRLGPAALIGESRVPGCHRIEIDDVSLGYWEGGFGALQNAIYPVYVLGITYENDEGASHTAVYLPAVSAPLEVTIDTPSNGLEVAYGTPVTFSGSVVGGLPPYTYAWASDRDGALGTEASIDAQLHVNVSEGQVHAHTVSLRVTDQSGMYVQSLVEVTVLAPSGDLEGDGDVDLGDYAVFYPCLAGPGVSTPPAGCLPGHFERADLEGDSDVDLADFAAFTDLFTGPGVCGNGVVEEPEQCDAGGESAACDTDCTSALCGDGTHNATAGEQCDTGGESAACDADCTFVTCGDHTVNPTAGEECDDGGESATCDADCTVAVCGDGTTNATAGEACDDGGESATCDADCTPAQCPDATVNHTAGEECDDDGESVSCDTNCTAAWCGDGTLNVTAGEQCDDGNTNNGDGCSATCQNEGFSFCDDFEDGNIADWTVEVAGAGVIAPTNTMAQVGLWSLRMFSPGTPDRADAVTPVTVANGLNFDQPYIVTFFFRLPVASYHWFEVMAVNRSPALGDCQVYLAMNYPPALIYRDPSGNHTIASLDLNQWYDFQVMVRPPEGRYDVLINGMPVALNIPFAGTAGSSGYKGARVGDRAAGGSDYGQAYWDMICIQGQAAARY